MSEGSGQVVMCPGCGYETRRWDEDKVLYCPDCDFLDEETRERLYPKETAKAIAKDREDRIMEKRREKELEEFEEAIRRSIRVNGFDFEEGERGSTLEGITSPIEYGFGYESVVESVVDYSNTVFSISGSDDTETPPVFGGTYTGSMKMEISEEKTEKLREELGIGEGENDE